MKLTHREVKEMKATYQAMIDNPVCEAQRILASYWLNRLNHFGVYAMRENLKCLITK